MNDTFEKIQIMRMRANDELDCIDTCESSSDGLTSVFSREREKTQQGLMCKPTQSTQVTHLVQNRNTGESIQQDSGSENAHREQRNIFALCTLVWKFALPRGLTSDDPSSQHRPALGDDVSIHGQHLVARLQLSFRRVPRDLVTMQTRAEVTRDTRGSRRVVHTPSSSIVPSNFVRTTSVRTHSIRDYRQNISNFVFSMKITVLHASTS